MVLLLNIRFLFEGMFYIAGCTAREDYYRRQQYHAMQLG